MVRTPLASAQNRPPVGAASKPRAAARGPENAPRHVMVHRFVHGRRVQCLREAPPPPDDRDERRRDERGAEADDPMRAKLERWRRRHLDRSTAAKIYGILLAAAFVP